jgi:methyl-accepting chemotaxis protein
MLKLPKLSVAAKLYAIVALLVLATAVVGAVAVINSRWQSALMDEFETSFLGTQNVERVNGLIYAVVMESRGIYMSPDIQTAKRYGESLLKFNGRIAKVVEEWRRAVRADDGRQFDEFAKRIAQFIQFRNELVRLGTEESPTKGREWGDNEANRSVRTALNKDLDGLAALYDARSRRIYAELERITARTVWALSVVGILSLILAGAGAVFIWRAVARPLGDITRVTAAVAGGAADMTVPHCERHDEIGGLARSIGIFQDAMRRNVELNRTVSEDAAAHAEQRERVDKEIEQFGAEAEKTVADLAAISEQMLTASAHLAEAAAQAANRTAVAASASTEASENVRDIAAAAEQLSLSVMEIDRQVVQSKAIADKANGEAERTNKEIRALDEAAKRIGDVVKLITAIAEQTNLLALNATIEAARAGEAGKGFAVVAQEVKALAGQTAKATDEISSHIAGMQDATMRSVDAIGVIQRTIREVGETTTMIAAAVTEQGAATREIARSAEIASQRTILTSGEVNRVGEATDDTRKDSATVKTVAEGLGIVAHSISNQVNGFFQRLRAA